MPLRQELPRLLSMYGVSPKKRLGQNFLVDARVLSREVGYAGVEGKRVLEIGPGFGFLTKKIAEKAREVVAIEKDARLLPALEKELAEFRNVTIVQADFLKQKFEGRFELVMSNVPYAISSPLLFKLAEMDFGSAVLCLQKEFAERMVAEPGTKDYSRLTVMCDLKFEVELLEIVPRSAFVPIPKVDSAIVRLRRKQKVGLDKTAEKIIALLFEHKRKTIRAALADSARNLGVGKAEMRAIAGKIEGADRRVMTLRAEELLRICKNKELCALLQKR